MIRPFFSSSPSLALFKFFFPSIQQPSPLETHLRPFFSLHDALSDIPALPSFQQPSHLPLHPRPRDPRINIHPLTSPPAERTHHLVRPLLTPPLRSTAPHRHLSHRALERAQYNGLHPPDHVRTTPVGVRFGRKGTREKLRGMRVGRADELVKVAVCLLVDCPGSRTCGESPHGRGRRRGAHEEGPVQGVGLGTIEFVPAELDEFEGVAPGWYLDWDKPWGQGAIRRRGLS